MLLLQSSWPSFFCIDIIFSVQSSSSRLSCKGFLMTTFCHFFFRGFFSPFSFSLPVEITSFTGQFWRRQRKWLLQCCFKRPTLKRPTLKRPTLKRPNWHKTYNSKDLHWQKTYTDKRPTLKRPNDIILKIFWKINIFQSWNTSKI